MNEVVLKILAQIALNQGDIPKLIKQLQAEVAKAAGVEIPIKFQKPPSDASIRSLIQRSREEFALQGVRSPSNAQLLQQLEAQAARQGLLERFPPEQIRHLGERQLQLEVLKQEEKLAKERENSVIRQAQLEVRLAKQKEANLLKQAQLEEKTARQKERETVKAEKSVLDRAVTEAKLEKLPELEAAIAKKKKFEFDPYSPENRGGILQRAYLKLSAINPDNPDRVWSKLLKIEEEMNLRRLRSLELLGKTAGQTNMQISATSNYLLAVSSILRPISPMLSNLAMSAGFAAFSLGPVPALLTAASAGLGAWINLLKMSSAETTRAGLATREWRETTFQYNMTVRAFLVTIGRDVQTSFAPTVDLLEQLADSLNNLPLEKLIESTARGADFLLKLALAAEKFIEPHLELFTHIQDLGVTDPLGTKASNTSMDFFLRMLGVPQRTDKDRPTYFPNTQFNIRDVRDVGNSIQQSILRNAVEDQILAETVKANEQREETNKLLREGFRKSLINSTGANSSVNRGMFFPWLIGADSM